MFGKIKTILAAIGFFYIGYMCYLNPQSIVIKMPFVNQEVYLPLYVLILISFPLWAIIKFLLRMFLFKRIF